MIITVDGAQYRVLRHPLSVRHDGLGHLTISTGETVPTRRCDHCGRVDWIDRVATSYEEAAVFGWVAPVEDVL